ncbi:hypothetical protein [Bacillus smithii]
MRQTQESLRGGGVSTTAARWGVTSHLGATTGLVRLPFLQAGNYGQ